MAGPTSPSAWRLGLVALTLPAVLSAQDRLRAMPGYDNYTAKAPLYSQNAMVSGAITGATWATDGKSLEYAHNGKRFRAEIGARRVTEVAAPAGAAPGGPGGPGGRGGMGAGGGMGMAGRGGAGAGASERCGLSLRVERGRQSPVAASPDGKLLALHRDRNLKIANADCSGEFAVSTDGNVETGIKYGTGSWVYGEELGQNTAIWWNRASSRVAYYRFDESKVKPFYLTMDVAKINTTLDIEGYPKAGADNPLADIYVFDVASRRTVKLDVRSGQPNVDGTVGYYVYGARWSPDDRELLVERTNRLQNVMELIACLPETGACRVVFREEWPTGWVENSPPMRYLADSQRFILTSERNGYNNLYLHDLSGKLINPITALQAEVVQILRVDEATRTLWYTARDGDNFMKVQLHRVGLDGKGDVRLTDPQYTHAVTLSPDGKHFIDVAQNITTPPFTRLLDANGRVVVDLARSDISRPTAAGLRPVEQFTFLAADGVTKLYGSLHKPIDFDPAKRYPVIVNVYGGPASGSNTPTETYAYSSAATEYGFITVNLHTRASPGMGKRTLDALYLKLGQTEIDDMARGIQALASRPYINSGRVGIAGTSYGGYASAMALLRYPDVFHAAVANSAVTAWDHYDTIYTERFMSTPQLNPDG